MTKLQLVRVLRQFVDENDLEKSVAWLARAIQDVDERGPDARTLKSLFTNPGYAPKRDHLDAFHAFLLKNGKPGLDSVRVFEVDGLLSSLLETRRIKIFLPPLVQDVPDSKDDVREYFSAFDFHAYHQIVDSINEKNEWGGRIRIDVDAEPLQRATALESYEWKNLISAGDRSYCVVGSPLVSGLAGYMLGKMFGIQFPFRKPGPGAKRLPFYFCWHEPSARPAAREPYPNAFALSANDLDEFRPPCGLQDAIRARRAQSFVVGDQAWPVMLNEYPHDQYGVVVAQRRGPKSLWVVVAGLSGPGTFACAQMLEKIETPVPDCAKEGEVSEVVYAVVKSKVEFDETKTFGDKRKVVSPEFVPLPVLPP